MIQRDLLLYFCADAISSQMYPTFKGNYSTADLKAVFLALKTLGLVVRTNPRGTRAPTFCISRTGRQYLEAVYHETLPHPDEQRVSQAPSPITDPDGPV